MALFIFIYSVQSTIKRRQVVMRKIITKEKFIYVLLPESPRVSKNQPKKKGTYNTLCID